MSALVQSGRFGTAAFVPTDISGIKLWLKADALSLADNDPISTFTDQSGSGNDFTAAGGARPTFKTAVLDGRAIARFDGSDDQMSPAANPLSGASAGTLFVVVKLDADPPSQDTLSGHPAGGWGTDATDAHFPYTDGVIYDDWGTTVRKTVGNPTPALTSWRIYAAQTASGLWRAYLAGGAPLFTTATNTVGWNATAANVFIGRGGTSGAYRLDGDLAEVIAYNSQLSLADLDRVGAYLVAKYPTLAWSAASN